MNIMHIEEGFQIESPDVFVPWVISQKDLQKLLGKHGLKCISTGYYVISCISLGGMQHELGFRFDPQTSNGLSVLEFFLKPCPDAKQSYESFQSHFEAEFGKPTKITPGTEGFETCIWEFDSIEIVHSVYERFVLTEYMAIKRDFKKNYWTIKNIYYTIQGYCGNPTSIHAKILCPVGLLIFSFIVLLATFVMLMWKGFYNSFRFLLSFFSRH